jgi:3-phenylpropionate/trans-cinnamate dioxygenase ferredoxin subunit
MSDFVPVAKTTDLSDPGQMLAEVDDRIVVLFKVDGQYFCIDDVCTHDGGPLDQGELDGNEIECPRHGARFDVTSGRATCMPAIVPVKTGPRRGRRGSGTG